MKNDEKEEIALEVTVHYFNSFFPILVLVCTCLQYKSFENTVGKEEIACNKQLFLFQVFSMCIENFMPCYKD